MLLNDIRGHGPTSAPCGSQTVFLCQDPPAKPRMTDLQAPTQVDQAPQQSHARDKGQKRDATCQHRDSGINVQRPKLAQPCIL